MKNKNIKMSFVKILLFTGSLFYRLILVEARIKESYEVAVASSDFGRKH